MTIPSLPFGRTGHESTRLIFGAAALARVSQDVADRALDVLLEHGVNHIDVAASYGDAELRVRPWLRSHPGRFFVATKTGARTAAGAREDLNRSLDRLGVDRVDLWQLHNLVDPIEWDLALSAGGAVEAAIEAREAGLVRFVGVTGHGSSVAAAHRRSLERFDFDSVLLPCNYLTMRLPYYRENFETLADTCRLRRIAVQTIKSIAFRPWMGRERTRSTWYEPLQSQPDIDAAVWWVLGRPDVFLITAGDVGLLPRVLAAAERFERAPAEGEMEALAERARLEPLFV